MLYFNLNIPLRKDFIYKEIEPLTYEPLIQHLDQKTYPDWLLADIPKHSYTMGICDVIVSALDTQLQLPPRALRFQPPQVNTMHVDGPLAKGVINIVIEEGFQLQIEDNVFQLDTSVFDVKKMHRLLNIHSTIHLVRMDVCHMYDQLLATAQRKGLIRID